MVAGTLPLACLPLEEFKETAVSESSDSEEDTSPSRREDIMPMQTVELTSGYRSTAQKKLRLFTFLIARVPP